MSGMANLFTAKVSHNKCLGTNVSEMSHIFIPIKVKVRRYTDLGITDFMRD